MASTDSNGIMRVDANDDVSPLFPVFNSLAQSVSNAFDANTRIWPVANEAGRTAKVTEIGIGNISSAKPLFVWRANAATGRNLEYTVNGSVWFYYDSSADTALAKTWRVANVAGRTNIFTAVGPGSTANPVMVWRADAPAGRQLEYNVTSNDATANWHYVPSNQDWSRGNITPSVLTGTIRWVKTSTSVTIFYDLSGTITGDALIASIPEAIRSFTPSLLAGTEYLYGGQGNNPVYLNVGAVDLRCPTQTGTTRRVGNISYPIIPVAW